ncbi:MAG: hypothetical protein R3C24_07560 [Cyanobacteriota/Melainabacteria group bacterium]
MLLNLFGNFLQSERKECGARTISLFEFLINRNLSRIKGPNTTVRGLPIPTAVRVTVFLEPLSSSFLADHRAARTGTETGMDELSNRLADIYFNLVFGIDLAVTSPLAVAMVKLSPGSM